MRIRIIKRVLPNDGYLCRRTDGMLASLVPTMKIRFFIKHIYHSRTRIFLSKQSDRTTPNGDEFIEDVDRAGIGNQDKIDRYIVEGILNEVIGPTLVANHLLLDLDEASDEWLVRTFPSPMPIFYNRLTKFEYAAIIDESTLF